MFVYLDNSSTTKPYDEAVMVMTKVLSEDFGNPSSLHSLGIAAEKYVKAARKSFAKSIGASEDEVYFTSCGTESDNMALLEGTFSRKARGKKIITTKVEHPAVLEPASRLEAMGFEVEYIGVDNKCRLDMKQLQNAITEDTVMISVMTVNNETGTVMPIKEIADIKNRFNKEHGCDILFHTDAVQAYGKIQLDLNGIDMMSVSGHKIHGPKGVGGIYIRKGVSVPPYLIGGGQERNMRSGTENTAGIAGFGKAIDISAGNFQRRAAAMTEARNRLLEGIKAEIKDIVINSPEDKWAGPSVLSVSFLGTRGEVLLHTLEQDRIFVSTGSACSSNKKGQSHVLRAMGLDQKT
ncbi:MAG: cysteine desulfurase family protein, partial [Anaerovoracaceae bacterium]|nr:cysteine desulfurase family protein [Anaerovoracaceae bacterium]